MKQSVIPFLILIIGCSTNGAQTDKSFSELTDDEKTESLRELGDELTGDYLTYSGVATIEDYKGQKTLDSAVFVELVFDSDKRFVIRHRFVGKEVKTDSMTFYVQGGLSNKGTGEWSDLGDLLELRFQLGTVDSFFDKEENRYNIDIIDNYTLRLHKKANQVWIWKTLCKKEL